ncbi:glycosyltransferase [Gordonia hankookensis]|uniref:Glycosyltransferase family 1 protein n=1 Tax=Gordonia hankookensis TaxID=589403 RepID=A0ABR7W872_9ACTN|nr:glycosyltransferase [Gordonia hankookensis]MBD1319014.1 glycosyltransferase family 1 protein [Gordonia hankookensis]
MRNYRFGARSESPRILCVSYRAIDHTISRSIRYEFEDLVAAVDAVDVIAPTEVDPAGAASSLGASIRTIESEAVKVIRRLQVKSEVLLPDVLPRRRPPGAAAEYDLVFVSVEGVHDLYSIGSSAMWRALAPQTICHVQELYSPDVPALGDLLGILKGFDQIFVGCQGTVETLSAATGRPCHYLAPSTDTLNFCPYPDPPKRLIDFYAMGRRPPKTHAALMRLAEDPAFYYLYDTVPNCPIADHVEHRDRFAEMIKRSRFFLVNPARCDDPDRTGGQQELGYRYVEGAAGGAVLIGEAPRNASFDDDFGWPDAVISLPFDSPDVSEVIDALTSDPDRLERIAQSNVANCLRRHDHVYRWGQILAAADLGDTAAMSRRRHLLEERAESIERAMVAVPD